jgi:hypothetical protein
VASMCSVEDPGDMLGMSWALVKSVNDHIRWAAPLSVGLLWSDADIGNLVDLMRDNNGAGREVVHEER